MHRERGRGRDCRQSTRGESTESRGTGAVHRGQEGTGGTKQMEMELQTESKGF